jgi:DNA-binding transcriptional regulator YbjK
VTPSAPRRVDPLRRERIIDAALALIVEVGVRGVTHRRVAKAADVSLSATTYYFDSLDDLLEQAFLRSVERDVENLRAAIDGLGARDDPLEVLAEIIHQLAADRGAAIVASELGVAALRNERLARLTRAWSEAWAQALADHFDAETARLAVLLATSLIQASTLADAPISVGEIHALLRRAIHGGRNPVARPGS